MRNDFGASVVVSAAAAATSTKIRHALQARVCIRVICVLQFGRDSRKHRIGFETACSITGSGAPARGPGAPLSMSTVTRALARCQQILHHSRDGCNVHCTRSPGEQARAGHDRREACRFTAGIRRTTCWNAGRQRATNSRMAGAGCWMAFWNLDETVFLTSPELAARYAGYRC